MVNLLESRRQADLNDYADDYELWAVEQLSQQLCQADEWQAYHRKKAFYKTQTQGKVLMFPVWSRYRYEAQLIHHLRQKCPWLRHFPLWVSRWLRVWLLPSP